MWASLGLSLVSSFLGSRSANKQADAQAYADNTVRAANNEKSAAEASLAATVNSLRTQNQLKAGAGQYEAIQQNAANLSSMMTKGSIVSQLQAAKAMGAVTAQAAAAGVTGSTVALYKRTMATRDAMNTADRQQAFESSTWQSNMAAGNTMGNALRAIDQSMIIGNMDRSQTVARNTNPFLTSLSPLLGAAAGYAVGGAQGAQGGLDFGRSIGLGLAGQYQAAQNARDSGILGLGKGINNQFTGPNGSYNAPVVGWGSTAFNFL